MRNKKEFVVKENDKELQLAVIRPTFEIQNQANLLRIKTFAQAVQNGALLRVQLDDHMRKIGLWNEEKRKELTKLNDKMEELLLKLKKGGIKLSEAKDIALEVKKLRNETQSLLVDRTSMDANTAEGQSENESLQYLISRCIVYNKDGEPYFKAYEDYLENRRGVVAREGFQNYVDLISDVNSNFELNLPENKFLKEYHFIDDKLRLIDKEGRLIDSGGRLVDEQGRWINDKGELIDKLGNILDDKGDFAVETSPFLDDEGKPIVEEKKKSKK